MDQPIHEFAVALLAIAAAAAFSFTRHLSDPLSRLTPILPAPMQKAPGRKR
jgi:hypothetical protein